MRSAMHLPSDVHICDTDHQNSINSFDIYSRHKQSVYDTLCHEKPHLVVESHLKLYF